jgi:hypothetical protein
MWAVARGRGLLETGGREDGVEAGVVGCQNLAGPVQAHDPRRPVQAHSITPMRPFSRRWAIVSAPLPGTVYY